MRSFTAMAVLVVVTMLGQQQQLVARITIDLGGEAGWTIKANYDKWLSTFKIKIGDTLSFCNGDTTDHTAVDVDKEAYDTCGESGQTFSTFDHHQTY